MWGHDCDLTRTRDPQDFATDLWEKLERIWVCRLEEAEKSVSRVE